MGWWMINGYIRAAHCKNVFPIYHNRWLTPRYGMPGIKSSAFQCSDDAFDIKVRGESIICGLRNGTVELYNIHTLHREMSLEDQQGSVQVNLFKLKIYLSCNCCKLFLTVSCCNSCIIIITIGRCK